MTSAPAGGSIFAVDARDGFVLTPDVGNIVRVAGYDLAVFDQEAHGDSSTEDNEENKGLFCLGGQMCPSGGCWLEKQRSADDIGSAAP